MEKLIIHTSKSAQVQPWKLLVGSDQPRRPPVWDSGSSLYDSFELDSFQRRLDSACHSRSLSLPHLGDRLQPQPPPIKQGGSRISRSLKKIVRSVFFRRKLKSEAVGYKEESVNGSGKGRRFAVLEDDVVLVKGNAVLSTITEAREDEKKAELMSPDKDMISPRRSGSFFMSFSFTLNRGHCCSAHPNFTRWRTPGALRLGSYGA